MDIFWPDFEFLRNCICIAEAKQAKEISRGWSIWIYFNYNPQIF